TFYPHESDSPNSQVKPLTGHRPRTNNAGAAPGLGTRAAPAGETTFEYQDAMAGVEPGGENRRPVPHSDLTVSRRPFRTRRRTCPRTHPPAGTGRCPVLPGVAPCTSPTSPAPSPPRTAAP